MKKIFDDQYAALVQKLLNAISAPGGGDTIISIEGEQWWLRRSMGSALAFRVAEGRSSDFSKAVIQFEHQVIKGDK